MATCSRKKVEIKWEIMYQFCFVENQYYLLKIDWYDKANDQCIFVSAVPVQNITDLHKIRFAWCIK